jgi:hypothetical protein
MRYPIIFAALFALAPAALAEDATINLSAAVKVGETKQITIIGGHSSDCRTSIPGDTSITRSPGIGTLSQRANVPYVFTRSISRACYGAHLVGTAIDYTALKAGLDHVRLDAVFPNGRARFNISIANR